MISEFEKLILPIQKSTKQSENEKINFAISLNTKMNSVDRRFVE